MSVPPEVLTVLGHWVERAELLELTPYAVESRYPGTWDLQTRTDAERAVQFARGVRQAVRQRLPGAVLGRPAGA